VIVAGVSVALFVSFCGYVDCGYCGDDCKRLLAKVSEKEKEKLALITGLLFL
jgi:hypothetical protein